MKRRFISAMAGNVISEVPQYLCCQCGLCEAVCPHRRISLIRDIQGNYRPAGPSECKDCKGICLSVCPGRTIFTPVKLADSSASYHELVGPYRKIYVVKASDKEIQYHSSSGGAVTALLQYLLTSGQIDGAVVTKLDETSPLEPRTFIARSAEEILSAQGSKYLPVPACRAVRDIWQNRERKDEKYVFVGIPCQINGILHAKTRIPRLKKQICLTFSLFCGRNATLQVTRYALRQHGIELDEVQQIKFRSQGWPGNLTVMTKDGREHVIDRRKFFVTWSNGFFNLDRCTTCNDVVGENADLCFGDPLLPEMFHNKIGLSVVIAKTEKAVSIIEDAQKRKYIDIISELPVDRLILSQIGQFKKKKLGIQAVYFMEKLRGRKIPQFNGKLPKQTAESLIYTFFQYVNNNISKIPFFFSVYMKIPMKFWDIVTRPFKKNIVKVE
jgi:coenzyme F420 hydrogenase subunit beta